MNVRLAGTYLPPLALAAAAVVTAGAATLVSDLRPEDTGADVEHAGDSAGRDRGPVFLASQSTLASLPNSPQIMLNTEAMELSVLPTSFNVIFSL